MRVVAKFRVEKVAEYGNYSGGGRQEITKPESMNSNKWVPTGVPVREITLSPVYSDGTGENASFAATTPSGSITFKLNNEACADEFKPGDFYYVSFDRVTA